MRKLLALILVLGICSQVFADVTATIVSKDIDENGNIRIWTTYSVDGVEVESRYPKIDGKSVYCTRYNVLNFQGMNATQKKARIKKDIVAFQKSLIQKKYLATVNTAFDLTGIIGQNNTETSASMIIDSNDDGVPDTEWTVFTNGTRTEQAYIPE